MIKKLILLLVILFVLYVLSVFMMPQVASQIDSILGIPGFSQSIKGTKDNIDKAITNIPTTGEFKSGALDIKDTFIDGVGTTKETIDSIRGGAQQVEETYNEVKDTFDELKDTYDNAVNAFSGAKEKIDEVQWVIDSVSSLTGTWSN